MQLLCKLKNLEGKIGNTPIVKVGGVYCKVEGENPAGSIKDRTAFVMVKRAIERGELTQNGTIVEATSGNTGIGLAYIARELGIKAVIVMPDNMTQQRRDMIASYGAELLLTPSKNGMQGAVEKAIEYAGKNGGWIANQFGNFDGIDAHFLGTAPEIFAQLPNVKYIVAGIGSGGTVMGIKKYILANNLDCKVVGVEPKNSPLITKGYAGAHKIQGIGANFLPEILDVDKIDIMQTVDDDDAINTKTALNAQGIDCGISSGGAYYVACQLHAQTGSEVLAILPDSANRY